MNIEKVKELKVGQEFKSYRDLCEFLDEKSKNGDAKVAQIKNWNEWFEFKKADKGYRLTITKIHRTKQPKIDGRGKHGNHVSIIKDTPSMLVDEDDYKSIGVYRITLDNSIYVGSTSDSFRTRYLKHTYETNSLPTKKMLEDGGVFEILEFCDGMKESDIRRKENKWIQEYKLKKEFEVLNKKDAWKCEVEKHRNIKVLDSEYNDAVEILEYYGYKVFE